MCVCAYTRKHLLDSGQSLQHHWWLGEGKGKKLVQCVIHVTDDRHRSDQLWEKGENQAIGFAKRIGSQSKARQKRLVEGTENHISNTNQVKNGLLSGKLHNNNQRTFNMQTLHIEPYTAVESKCQI